MARDFLKLWGGGGAPILPDSTPLARHCYICLYVFQTISIYYSLGTLATPPISLLPLQNNYC